MRSEKIITIFGSSRIRRGSKAYEEAYRLGKLLADAGFIVCNGGYGGAMEASSRGAQEAGGKTIGITTEVFRNASPNPWIDVESKAENYIQRMMVMISLADAFVVLKGGIGTLAEMALVWTLTAIGELRKPMLLVGGEWRGAIDDLAKHLLIRGADMEILNLVETPEDALKLLDELWSNRAI